jgi:hypothetical protein
MGTDFILADADKRRRAPAREGILELQLLIAAP